MKNLKKWSLALMGLWIFASVAEVGYAQGGGRGGQGGGGRGPQTRMRFELATLPEVQTELKLNDEQKKMASEQLAKYREKLASMVPGGGGGGGAGGGARAELQKLGGELDAQFVGKLDDGQNSRMNGIVLQVNGPAAIADAMIAKSLEITEEQSAKIKAANDANQAARRESMQSGQDLSQEERAAARTKLAEEHNKTLMAILTEAQAKKLESLKGAALTIDMTPLRPARRGQ